VSDDKKQSGSDTGTAALVIASAVVGADIYDKTKHTPLAVAVGTLGAGAAVWGRISGRVKERFDRFMASWSSQAESELPPPGEERDRAVEESGDVLIEHVQLLMRALDPAVIPALGRLAAPYIAGAKPDAFFRGATRMISEFSEGQLVDAQRIFHATWGVPVDISGAYVSTSGPPFRVYWRETKIRLKGGWLVKVPWAIDDAEPVFRAMRLAGLADNDPMGSSDFSVGPGLLYLPRNIITRLARALGPPTGDSPPAPPDDPVPTPVAPPSRSGAADPR